MKCKACENTITRIRINKHTGLSENLCSHCLSIALRAAWNLDDELDGDDDDIVEVLGGDFQ